MKNVFYYNTPIGIISITDNGKCIIAIDFGKTVSEGIEIKETDIIKETYKQLNEYFNGKRKEFNIPLEMEGTDFQKSVWNALRNIPYGETCSYKDIAAMIGNEKASRAVGMANNKNPIPIIVPCHRVIGANGKLVGYGGGLELKTKLLDIEKIYK